MLKKNASIIYLGLVISKQHGDVMPSSCHSEKMLWNPSIHGHCTGNETYCALQVLWGSYEKGSGC